MAKGRPGGNPDLKKHQFKTERKYPLTESMTIKFDRPTKEALTSGKLPNWREIAREAVAKALAEQEREEDNLQSV